MSVAGDLLYGPGRDLHALATADGHQRWTSATGQASAPAMKPTTHYAFRARRSPVVHSAEIGRQVRPSPKLSDSIPQ